MLRKFWEHWKELSADVLLILALAFFLIMFTLFELRGWAAFEETNALIRHTEQGVLVLILALAFERLISDIRRF